jgi:hypothetical protein
MQLTNERWSSGPVSKKPRNQARRLKRTPEAQVRRVDELGHFRSHVGYATYAVPFGRDYHVAGSRHLGSQRGAVAFDLESVDPFENNLLVGYVPGTKKDRARPAKFRELGPIPIADLQDAGMNEIAKRRF